jgi:photosystem II stability/assembly factor-like uncharacterized protein
MKTLLIVSFSVFIAIKPLLAQWVAVDSTVDQRWNAVYFTSENTGYVAGFLLTAQYNAKIKKTTDSGNSWYSLTIPPPISDDGWFFIDIFFIDANTGFTTGGRIPNPYHGVILKTTNGGDSWDTLAVPINNEYTSVYFVNSNTGYATGYAIIIKTTNGGNSWVVQNPNNFNSFLTKVFFTDANTGYAIGLSGTILKTTDGGNNWLAENSGTSVDLNGLDFADANTGIATGGFSDNSANVIIRTTNAGNNWITIPYSNSTCNLWRVKFMSSSTGYIAGYCGQILRTTDGGANWCTQTSNFNNNFTECFFTNNNTGFIAGRAPIPGMKGYILKTTDGGGNCIPTGIESSGHKIPEHFQLFQNYPNPFNPATSIKFNIPQSNGKVNVKLTVFDALGREVTTLVNEEVNPGSYEVTWDASNYPSGVYFYKLTAGDYTKTRKMILIK